MPLDPRIQQAFQSADPLTQLRSLASRLQSDGQDSPTILALFETSRQHYRDLGEEDKEDTVMEVMDFLVGWCSPHMR